MAAPAWTVTVKDGETYIDYEARGTVALQETWAVFKVERQDGNGYFIQSAFPASSVVAIVREAAQK